MSTQETPVSDSPPEWIHDYSKEIMSNLFFNGDLVGFYEIWSDFSKTCISYPELGKKLAAFEQTYGRIDRIGDTTSPTLHPRAPGFWCLTLYVYVQDIQFFTFLSFNKDKRLGDFQIGRSCIYHPPDYIKEARFERVTLASDPLVLYSKPTKVSTPQFPVALLIHAACQLSVDGRIGFCFPYKDLEYLPSANIGLIRGEFNEDMLDTGDPIPVFTGRLMQFALNLQEINSVFLIIQAYAALYIPKIARKFSGTIAGIVLINPAWDTIPESPMETMSIEKYPKGIPTLIICSGNDQVLDHSHQNKWKEAASKIRADYEFYDQVDHFLFSTPEIPPQEEYKVFEKHMSDVPLRRIAQWIRGISEGKK